MATAVSAIPDDIQRSETVRVYCPTHNLGFTAPRAKQIRCEANGHELDQNFPYSSFWEYCCDCQHYWPLDPATINAAETECPVCERRLAKRFVCQYCKIVSVESEKGTARKVYSLSTLRGPSPGCPGCFNAASAPLVEHECPEFKTTFLTTHSTCPFCETVLELPPAFPCPVGKYLDKIHVSPVSFRFNAERNRLEESATGHYLLLEKVPGSPVSIVLPQTRNLTSKQEYYDRYYELFNCENPGPGEVIVLSPAVVDKVDGSWVLREAGFVEMKPDPQLKVVASRIVCPACSAEADPTHAFCKRCGAPVIPTASSTTSPSAKTTVLPALQVPNQAEARIFNPIQPGATLDQALTEEAFVQSAGSTGPGVPVKGIIGGLICALVVMVVLISVFNGKSALEQKLDNAIARGDLMGQNADSARTLYAQLQSNGTSSEKLKAYRDRLIPLLTNHGYQLTQNLLDIGFDEPTSNEWVDAGNKLDWAVELNPSDQQLASRAAYCDGRAAYLQKRLDEAQEAWTRAVNLDKTWILPVNGIGMVYVARRDYSTARAYFIKAKALDPKWPFPYENIGNTYWQEKDFTSATSAYREALERAPNWAKPHQHLGEIAFSYGDYASAVAEFEAALAPNAIGLKSNEAAQLQHRLSVARQKL